MNGYRAEPELMRDLARRVEDVAEELRTAVRLTDCLAVDELGPPGIASALDGLIRSWADSIGAAHTEIARAASGIRTAARAYEDTDDAAARTLRRAAGGT
ncbi:type VII secretion target [Amycolatopsis sp. QT-25]|uniref:type VII secretion target n=1 Tax=Amycolatopsis sp. QT-25 TaxID=3034022 RepID=UPI0023EB4F9A|nr:type VII secretion target [Amycolatopsis sp. QT-25]WET82996.1 type VII secretion target [Amycolatopsis sp. QT-25]